MVFVFVIIKYYFNIITTIRCTKCDKCAFIFLLLSAHLDPYYIRDNIFGGINMLENYSLTDKFMSLLGTMTTKIIFIIVIIVTFTII